jgi:hypothetical protein
MRARDGDQRIVVSDGLGIRPLPQPVPAGQRSDEPLPSRGHAIAFAVTGSTEERLQLVGADDKFGMERHRLRAPCCAHRALERGLRGAVETKLRLPIVGFYFDASAGGGVHAETIGDFLKRGDGLGPLAFVFIEEVFAFSGGAFSLAERVDLPREAHDPGMMDTHLGEGGGIAFTESAEFNELGALAVPVRAGLGIADQKGWRHAKADHGLRLGELVNLPVAGIALEDLEGGGFGFAAAHFLRV